MKSVYCTAQPMRTQSWKNIASAYTCHSIKTLRALGEKKGTRKSPSQHNREGIAPCNRQKTHGTLENNASAGRTVVRNAKHHLSSTPSTVRQRNPLLRGIWSDWLHIPRAFTGRHREPKAQGSRAILSHAMCTWPRCVVKPLACRTIDDPRASETHP